MNTGLLKKKKIKLKICGTSYRFLIAVSFDIIQNFKYK